MAIKQGRRWLLCALGLSIAACQIPSVHRGAVAEARLNGAPAPTLRMDDLQYFVGSWLAIAEDPSTGRSFTLRYEVAPALDGTWLAGYGESPELGVMVQDSWGHDPVNGEIVRIIFDNQGTYGTVRSTGWEGDTLVLEGESRTTNGVISVRQTITRLDPGQFRAVWEAFREGGWTTYSTEHLRREVLP
jgi:hypothetical protein